MKRYASAIMICLAAFILFAACGLEQSAGKTSAVTETSEPKASTEASAAQETKAAPEIKVILNQYPYIMDNEPVWDGTNLWLPAGEVMSLLNLVNIDNGGAYICAWYMDENNDLKQCVFSDGQKSYSADSVNDIMIESDVAPYSKNGEIYITEAMIEAISGDFIRFDADSDTLELNIGNRDLSLLQQNNTSLFSRLKLKNKNELDDSRLNTLVSRCIANPPGDWRGWAEWLKKDGFTRARFTLNASDGPNVDFAYASIEKEIPYDYVEVYRYMKDLGIKTQVSLSFWDMAYRESGGKISKNRLSSEKELERYIEYVKMVVTRLKGLVYSYELWNEPDACYDFYQTIRVEDYIKMARRVIPVIRAIDPDAKIVIGATSSYIIEDCQVYSQKILESDVVSLADAISLHTVNNDASPDFHSDYYYGYADMWDGIKAAAKAQGFSGDYIADELNYRSHFSLKVLQPEPNDYHPVEPEEAAKYIARMIVINRGMDISVGMSGTDSRRPVETAVIRNMAYILDGLEAAKQTVQVETAAERVRYYTFKDKSGSLYVAVWNDIAAAVNCEPVECSVTLPGLSAKRVTALDPFNSVEQELVFNNETSGLVLDGLMLKDYPVIIRIQ